MDYVIESYFAVVIQIGLAKNLVHAKGNVHQQAMAFMTVIVILDLY